MCSGNVKEARTGIVRWARGRVIEMRSEGAEGAKPWRVLEAMIRILDFTLGEVKRHSCILVGEIIIFKGSLWPL